MTSGIICWHILSGCLVEWVNIQQANPRRMMKYWFVSFIKCADWSPLTQQSFLKMRWRREWSRKRRERSALLFCLGITNLEEYEQRLVLSRAKECSFLLMLLDPGSLWWWQGLQTEMPMEAWNMWRMKTACWVGSGVMWGEHTPLKGTALFEISE